MNGIFLLVSLAILSVHSSSVRFEAGSAYLSNSLLTFTWSSPTDMYLAPNGEFWDFVESWTLVRYSQTNTTLHIDIPDEQLSNRFCDPGSFISIPYSSIRTSFADRWHTRIEMAWSYTLVYADNTQTQYGYYEPSTSAIHGTSDVGLYLHQGPIALSVPETLFSVIQESIDTVIGYYSDRMVFEECSRVRQSGLPNIVISFHRDSVSYDIVYYPEDYTDVFDVEYDHCELLLGLPISDNMTPLEADYYFNPFRLNDVNYNFKRNSFSICDSSF
jgi:hypothetical protein